MSLTTRCPACRTLFKVAPDQLRISEGWVRCGQCDEVFDASAQLLPNPLGATLEPRVTDSMPGHPDDELPVESKLAPEQEQEQEQELLTQEPERPAAPGDVSFLHDQANSSLGHRPLPRAIYFLLGLALLLSLSGQIVFHERDRIAAARPGLKPLLLAFCSVLNCTLSPLRNIESITIDSSSLVKLQEDAYRLNFTLKNTAATALAIPAIELTLTDSLDQPLVRRVFLASELGVKSETLAVGIEWSASLAVAVVPAVLPGPVAGYRLFAFYP